MSKIKILFSALAVVVGIGGAFASKLDAPVILYQTQDGTYEKRVSPIGNCEGSSLNPCTMTYANDPDPSKTTFTLPLPPGGTPSQETKIWQ